MAKKTAAEKVRNRITKIRRQRGWSIHELTIRWRLEQNREFFEGNLDLIREAESGADIDEEVMEQISKALGVTLDYLYIP